MFRFIYVRGMFPDFGRFRGSGMCFNSYMCGECFTIGGPRSGLDGTVSIHICAGNVSSNTMVEMYIMQFQLIYAREIFRWMALMPLLLMLFQLIYARGMFQESFALAKCCNIVSTHICAGNVSPGMFTMESSGPCFNSYMCRECFRCNSPRRVQGRFNSYMCGECFYASPPNVLADSVSTHICAGNVSSCRRTVCGFWSRFNSYMCGECFVFNRVQARMEKFQLIYVRGMFLSRRRGGANAWEFQLIHARGVFPEESLEGKLVIVFQLIYVRGMFQHLCVVLPFQMVRTRRNLTVRCGFAP